MARVSAFRVSVRRSIFLLIFVLTSALLVACRSTETVSVEPAVTSTAAQPTPTQIPTLEPTLTPEPTLQATEIPTEESTALPQLELGTTRVNSGTNLIEVYVGNDTYLEAPAHFKPEYLSTNEVGKVKYDAPGLHLFVNEVGEWQVTPFEEVEFEGMQVIYGAEGEYTITSDTAKAVERRREFLVSWVQTEANADYRQEVYGTTAPTDEQVWEHLQANGLLLTEKFKVPRVDTKVFFNPAFQFVPELMGTNVDVNALGLVIVNSREWQENRYGVKTWVEAQENLTGKLDDKYMWAHVGIDGRGRVYVVKVNTGLPLDYQGDPYSHDNVLGGFDGVSRPSDRVVISQQFETIVNIFSDWRSAHNSGGGRYIYWYVVRPDYYGPSVRGSYGAYEKAVEEIYGEGKYLIEPVQ